jgi:hypothetical protein
MTSGLTVVSLSDHERVARQVAAEIRGHADYPNYLVDLGPKAQSEIYQKSSVDLAMRDVFRKMRHFVMTTKGLSENEAIS